MVFQHSNYALMKDQFIITRQKARFARVRAARRWGPAYQGSCIGPLDQSHPLDLVLKAPRARRIPAIRLLINDFSLCTWWSHTDDSGVHQNLKKSWLKSSHHLEAIFISPRSGWEETERRCLWLYTQKIIIQVKKSRDFWWTYVSMRILFSTIFRP